MRALIAGGGTGGHVIPALAIAGALHARYGAGVSFVGTARGLETRLVPAAGYPLDLITVGQLNRVSLATKAKTLVALPKGIWDCIFLLRRRKPDVVIGVGGYASGPAMTAAILLGTPALIFEPNAAPGLANRIAGKRVRAAAVNFAAAAAYFRNAEITGIPVRPEFFSLPARPPDAAPRLLVFGGSQGARALNQAMPSIVRPLLDANPGLTVLHQAGERHRDATQAAYDASGAANNRWRVEAFLDDMPRQFACADLILCRSGASTVAELSAAAKPSLLIPFPRAADDHQSKNAEAMAAAGAAQVLPEASLTPESLLNALLDLLASPERLAAMGDRARTLAHPDAAEKIAEMAALLTTGAPGRSR